MSEADASLSKMNTYEFLRFLSKHLFGTSSLTQKTKTNKKQKQINLILQYPADSAPKHYFRFKYQIGRGADDGNPLNAENVAIKTWSTVEIMINS